MSQAFAMEALPKAEPIDDQVKDIVEFLNALTGKFLKIIAPQLPLLVNDTLTPEI